jgi:hypothetical protein
MNGAFVDFRSTKAPFMVFSPDVRRRVRLPDFRPEQIILKS